MSTTTHSPTVADSGPAAARVIDMNRSTPRVAPSVEGPRRAVPRSVGATVAFACAAMLVSYLPFSAVNGVLGTIGVATGAGAADLQWLTDAFALALAATVLSADALGDLFGRRRVALAGLSLTALGAVVGFVGGGLRGAAAVHLLWVGQAVAGLGAGAVMSSTLALITAAVVEAQARSRAIAAWSAALVVGLGGGPFLAGAVVDMTWPWRWLFPPLTVLALAVIAFGATRAGESAAATGRRLDWPGQLTGAVGIAALIYGVIQGGASGWASPTAVVGVGVAVLALAAFVVIERRSPSPLLRPQLFASGGFVAAGLAATTVLFAVIGVVFVLSLFFAHQHVTDLGIAVRLGCLFGANAIASLATPRLQAALGPRVVLVTGLLVAAAGTATLLTITGATGLGGVAWRLLGVGAGAGLVAATSSVIAVQSVPVALAGMAGAANNAMRQLGGALGTAVIGVVLATQLDAGSSYADAVHACAATIVALLAAVTLVAAALLFGQRTRRRPAPTLAPLSPTPSAP